jgi:multidrug transporter EmrE-like cation transporter
MLLENKFGVTRPRLNIILLWVALIGFDTAAQLLFKLAAQSLDRPEVSWQWLHTIARSGTFWLAALCLTLTFPIWMLILRRSQLNLAFPATALTFVGVIGGSQLVFGESINPVQYAGIVLIVIGVALLRRSNR